MTTTKKQLLILSIYLSLLLVCYAILCLITNRHRADDARHQLIPGLKFLIFLIIPSSLSQGCELIQDGVGQFVYKNNAHLRVSRVDSGKGGVYTCTVTFTLDGVTGSMSETIDAWVSGENKTEGEKRNLPELRYGFEVSPQTACVRFRGQKKTKLTCRVSLLHPEEYTMEPRIHEPTGKAVKVAIGECFFSCLSI